MAMLNTAEFVAKLLTPVKGLHDAAMIADFELAGEAAAIAEASEKVTTITARRDAAAPGSRARAVQQIMLDWWEREFGDLVGLNLGSR